MTKLILQNVTYLSPVLKWGLIYSPHEIAITQAPAHAGLRQKMTTPIFLLHLECFMPVTILSSLNSASEIDNGAAQCYLKCRGWNGSERFTLLPRTKYRKKTTLANLFSYMCRAQRSRNQWLYPGKENKPPEADSEWTCSSKTKPRTVFCACNSCWLPWELPQRNCVEGLLP